VPLLILISTRVSRPDMASGIALLGALILISLLS